MFRMTAMFLAGWLALAQGPVMACGSASAGGGPSPGMLVHEHGMVHGDHDEAPAESACDHCGTSDGCRGLHTGSADHTACACSGDSGVALTAFEPRRDPSVGEHQPVIPPAASRRPASLPGGDHGEGLRVEDPMFVAPARHLRHCRFDE